MDRTIADMNKNVSVQKTGTAFTVLNTECGQNTYLELTLNISEESLDLVVEQPSKKAKSTLAELFRQAKKISQEFKRPNASSPQLNNAVQNSPLLPRKRLTRTISGAENALQGLRFINKTTSNADPATQWASVQGRFYKLANKEGLLSKDDFGVCIGMDGSTEFARELFHALARRKGVHLRSINIDQLREFWLKISDPSFDSRMQIFFDMCDKNADGRLSEDEVKEVLRLSASANNLSKLKDRAEEYAALIMEALDPHSVGYIELSQLEALMQDQAAGFETDSCINYSQALSQPLVSTEPRIVHTLAKNASYILLEYWRRVWILALWIGIMAGLFAWKFIQYRHEASFQVMGYCVCIAKGAAETLKLNMALILLPVCRSTITWLRSTLAGTIIPFDDNLNFHKIIAGAVVVGTVLHAGLHLTCDFPRLINAPEDKFLLIGRGFHYKKPSYLDLVKSIAGITGVIMVICLAIVFVLASHWFRRNLVKLPWPLHRMTGFNAFWYSHHLLVVVYVMLIVHSIFLFLHHEWTKKTTWIYLAAPMLLYVGERSFSGFRTQHYTVQIIKAAVYPGDVLSLQMTKPLDYKYQSGMYLFIKCPSISPFEWHPFSITSAPSDEYLNVHIRTSGDWTREMKNVFSKVCRVNKSGVLQAEQGNGDPTRFPKLLIDGPYGAPAQDYKKYDVLLLIGLGIGATPFISILKDILNDLKSHESRHNEVNLSVESVGKRSSRKHNGPTNAYFYWLTREQGSFEWFKGVMNEVAEMDHKAVIEMHNYLTSVYEEDDARSALITLLQSLHHERNGVDIVSGTQVRTHFAKPNWQKVFSRLAKIHPFARIGVFYCGSILLAREIDALTREYSHKRTTKFIFHKENF